MIRAAPVLAGALLALVAGCAAPPSTEGPEGEPPEARVWPAPPERARIRLLAAVRGPRDLGIVPSALTRLWEVVAGPERRAMVRPYAVAASGGLVAVADPGAGRVHLFDRDAGRYTAIARAGDAALATPVGVALGAGRVFVADSGIGRVFVFDHAGALLDAFTGFQRPTGLAFSRERGRLFVADATANRVVALDADGRVQFRIDAGDAPGGGFNSPTHLFAGPDALYVSDTMNFRVQVFDLDGAFLRAFGEHGDRSGYLAHPKGVSADADGNVYVVDALFNRVQIFDRQGRYLLAFGALGGGPGRFRLPAGAFIDGNRVYVADSYNQRIQVFEYLGEATR